MPVTPSQAFRAYRVDRFEISLIGVSGGQSARVFTSVSRGDDTKSGDLELWGRRKAT
jgi:hypothetical protein